MAKPLVALVGRPNVGKSTLFNRIAGRPLAIVADLPGTTRDRLYAQADWSGKPFTLIDTGGLDPAATSDIGERVREQAEVAIAEADVVVFLVDARDGLTSTDTDIAEILRRKAKSVVLAASKADSERRRFDAVEFYQLGLGEPIPISSLHGDIGDMLDAVVAHFPAFEEEDVSADLKIAIVGRPNVGKSSLLNALVGQPRAIVSDIPGTTRDALDTVVESERGRTLLIDTAGIRRRGRIETGIERYSVLRAMRAIDRCDVAILVLDASEGIALQDAHIAGYILESAKGVIVAVNKWDLVKKGARSTEEYTKAIRTDLNFMDYVPLIFISAKTGQRVDRLLDLAQQIKTERMKRIPTKMLNDLMQKVALLHSPPTGGGKVFKIYYATQAEIEPPTFVFFANDARLAHFGYQRFLENQLRQEFGFAGTPLKLVFKTRSSRRDNE
jgi:GTP-binding protein